MINGHQNQQDKKLKRYSKWMLAIVVMFTATFTFHAEDADAARNNRVRQRSKVVKRSAGVRKIVKHNNPSGVFALYQNAHFGYAKCLPKLTEPANTILKRNGIQTIGANDKERAALALGIAQVERLLNKPIPPNYRYHYQWKNASGAWNSGLSRVGFVTVKRPTGSPKGTLTGRMMHELGHRFGHADGNKLYNEYRSHMRGKKCVVSTYCLKSLNEEFAEVFEAYIVNPDFLAKHCPDSYSFFKNKVFRNPENLLASCEDPNSILDEDVDDQDDTEEQHDEEEIDGNPDFIKLPEWGPYPATNPRTLQPILNQDGQVVTEPVTVIKEVPVETATVDQAAAANPAAVVKEAQNEESIQGIIKADQQATSNQTQGAAEVAPATTAVQSQDGQWKGYVLPEGSKIPVPTSRPQK